MTGVTRLSSPRAAPASASADPSAGLADAVENLVQDALTIVDDEAGRALLLASAARLAEPLRLAFAGMVKAGKSTLLNAIIGEEIAPTDTGECTRVVIWYRYGHTPRITLHPLVGEPRGLPVARTAGRLTFDLDGLRADQVDHLVVEWPSPALRTITLIDTPGIASLSADVSERSTRFLLPEDKPSQADAIVYLMRHMHAADIRFLESFRDLTVGRSETVNTLAVLSRADEIGAGRLDSLISSRDIADRYRHDPTLRALSLGVVPIAGLLAQSARTLRQAEFAALAALALLPKTERARLLISADRFTRTEPAAAAQLSSAARTALLHRYGLFGIRLAIVLIEAGIDDAGDLSHELARRSGLADLLALVGRQFEARAEVLKARTALNGVQRVVLDRVERGEAVAMAPLLESIERIEANAHELRELRLLARLRTERGGLTASQVADAERLVGSHGIAASERLGLDDDAAVPDLRQAALRQVSRWRSLAESPLTDRGTSEVCRLITRSCEALVAGLLVGGPVVSRSRLVLAVEPRPRAGHEAGDGRGDS